MSAPFGVDVGEGDRVTALRYDAASKGAPVLVLAHGAGAPQSHPFMVEVARGLASRGVTVITFDFVYMEKKKKLPDKPARLESCWRAVLADVRARAAPPGAALLIGGKSMGGRIASQVAAAGSEGLAGLVFLGYPLHPPAKPAQLRAAHLPRVKAPMLFVQGEKDAFGTPEELAAVFADLGGVDARVAVVPGGDHSFKVPKRVSSPAEVMGRVMDEVARFAHARAGAA